MSREFLMMILALDIFVMGTSAYVVWDRINTNMTQPKVQAARLTKTPDKKPVEAAKPKPPEPQVKIKTVSQNQSKPNLKEIEFQYFDPISNRVSIVGDFNSWSPQLMNKDTGNRWHIKLDIQPGEYGYNFIVDGQMIRDPSNNQTKDAGKKFLSSKLVVQS